MLEGCTGKAVLRYFNFLNTLSWVYKFVPILPFPSTIFLALNRAVIDLTTMAPLDTGRFIITNSKFKNVVNLADANSFSDLHGDWRQNRSGEMVKYSLLYDNTQTDYLIQWNIVLLSNGNYTIKNEGYSSYATCEVIAKPDMGNNIVGGDHQQQWKIVQERCNYVCVLSDYDHFSILFNQYFGCECRICPTKNEHVYWHLADGESGTPVRDHFLIPFTVI